jgi:hypothetical protein
VLDDVSPGRGLILAPDPATADRVVAALVAGPGAPTLDTHTVSRLADLYDALAREAFGFVVVSAADAEGAPVTHEVKARVAAVDPTVAVIGYASAGPGLSDVALQLARAGVDELFLFGIDSRLDPRPTRRRKRLLEDSLAVIAKSQGAPARARPPADAGEQHAFQLYVDPGTAPAHVVADLLVALSNLHRAGGGSGLTFRLDEQSVVEVAPHRG